MSNAMKQAGHPIWSLLNLSIILAFVLLFSYINATNFDVTELKMIVEFIAVMGGWEFFKSRMRNSKTES